MPIIGKPKRPDFITEKSLCSFLGIPAEMTSERIKNLREKHQLPFLKVGKINRLYYLPDIFKWLYARKTVLGSETEDKQSEINPETGLKWGQK
jgi:hypothetical protein